MTKLTISLTAALFLTVSAQTVYARDLNTLEKVRESLWIRGVGTVNNKIVMKYANNDLGDNLEIPVMTSGDAEEDASDQTSDLPEELFVPLQDV